ncbi:MAG: hypothetical protein ACYS18_10760 [Planctomycetota bacterium]|jgi:hypothetical protein
MDCEEKTQVPEDPQEITLEEPQETTPEEPQETASEVCQEDSEESPVTIEES